ncbi:hypothetical protein AgCh_030874 [Apium graveolens]
MFKFSSSNNDDHANDKLDYGWNTTSQGYHDHLLRIERMPSVVTDLPRYPNIYMMLNNNNNATTHKGEAPQGHKKVHFIKKEKTKEASIDAEADGFIRQKHKKFELTKWETFKAV